MRIFLVLLSLVLGTPLPASVSVACQTNKDIFVYLDMSQSVTTWQTRDSTLSYFASALSQLLTINDTVLTDNDTLTLVPFADTTAPLPTISWTWSQHTVLDKLVADLRSPDHWQQYRPLSLDTRKTDLGKVLDHIGASLNTGRQQIFIIASDLAHDPDGMDCRDSDRRMTMASHAITDFVAAHRAVLRNSKRNFHIVLLRANAHDDCRAPANIRVDNKANIRVADKVTELLETSDVAAKTVNVLETHTGDYRQAILRAIARDVTLTVDRDSRLGPIGAARFSLAIANDNAFPVRVIGFQFKTNDGRTLDETHLDPPVKVRSCSSSRITTNYPTASPGSSITDVTVITDFGYSSAFSFEPQGMIVREAALYRFDRFFGETVLVVHLNAICKYEGPHVLTVSAPFMSEPRKFQLNSLVGHKKLGVFVTVDAEALVALQDHHVLHLDVDGSPPMGSADLTVATATGDVAFVPETEGTGVPKMAALLNAIAILGCAWHLVRGRGKHAIVAAIKLREHVNTANEFLTTIIPGSVAGALSLLASFPRYFARYTVSLNLTIASVIVVLGACLFARGAAIPSAGWAIGLGRKPGTIARPHFRMIAMIILTVLFVALVVVSLYRLAQPVAPDLIMLPPERL